MSPVIRVDEEVFGALQSQAEPFVDTPNDVLRRLLGLSGPSTSSVAMGGGRLPPGGGKRLASGGGERLPAGESTPNGMFRAPILSALAELGGKGRTAEILQLVEAKMSHILNAKDREWLPDGADIRWRKKAGWEAYNMQKEGLLVKGPPRGVWHLTERGQEEAQRQS